MCGNYCLYLSSLFFWFESYHLFSILFLCVGLYSPARTCGSSFIILTRILSFEVYFPNPDWSKVWMMVYQSFWTLKTNMNSTFNRLWKNWLKSGLDRPKGLVKWSTSNIIVIKYGPLMGFFYPSSTQLPFLEFTLSSQHKVAPLEHIWKIVATNKWILNSFYVEVHLGFILAAKRYKIFPHFMWAQSFESCAYNFHDVCQLLKACQQLMQLAANII